MVKSLTTDQEAARAADGHSLSRFIKLNNNFYSERDPAKVFSPDASETFLPILQGFKIRGRSANLGLEELPKIQRLDFAIQSTSEFGERPIDELVDDATSGYVGFEVIAYVVLRPLAGAAAPDSTDWIEMFRGEVEEVSSIRHDSVSFIAVDFAKRRGELRANRNITRTLFPDAPERNLGDVMPLVWGTVGAVPGIQVNEGTSSTLDESITAVELSINVADSSVFSASGKVQIGNEKIKYASISGSNLIVSSLSNRGVDGTDPAEHSFGQKVSQLQAIKFLVGDQDLTHNDAVDFAAAGTVKDINGSVFDSDLYAKSVEEIPAEGRRATFITVQDNGFPDITETLQNTRNVDPEDFDTPILLAVGASNDATNGANAADSKNKNATTFATNAHTTAATVSNGEILHVKQTNDLTGQKGDIKKVVAFCEYAVVPSQGESFPATTPEFQIMRGDGVNPTTRLKAVALAEPGAQDVDSSIFPEGSPDDDTTGLFATTGGSLGATTSHGIVYVSGAVGSQEWRLQDSSNMFTFYWNGLGGLSEGDSLDGFLVQSVSGSGALEIVITSEIGGSGTLDVDSLITKIDPADSLPATADKVVVTVTVRGDSLGGGISETDSTLRIRVRDGVSGTPYTNSAGNTESKLRNINSGDILSKTFTIEESLTEADLQNLRILIDSPSFPGGGRTLLEIEEAARFLVDLVSVSILDGTDLVGSDVAIDSSVLATSQRVTQELDISDELAAINLKSWGYFDGTGAFPPGFAIVFPGQTPSASSYQILVYRFGFRIEVLETTTRATAPNEFTLNVDSIGFRDVLDTLTAEGLIRKILGAESEIDFYNLTVARYDLVSLRSSLDTVALELASEDRSDWVLSRRLVQPLTNRELLGQALTDCSIRCVIEGGVFKFFPSISALPADAIRTEDANKTSTPVRTSTNIALVSNDLTLQYDESIPSPGKFQAEVNQVDSTLSSAISQRARTYQSHFIKDDNVAAAWAALSVDDFGFPRSLVNMNISGGPSIDLEVGDALAINDSFTRFRGQVGRVVEISNAGQEGSELALRLALTNKKIVLWQWNNEGDSDFSKIDVNQWTQTLFFTVDNVLVARMSGEVLEVRGNMRTDPNASSITNDVNSPDNTVTALNRSGSGDTGIVEYIPVPAGFSNGFIAMAVYDGATEEFYRTLILGYNTLAGPFQFDSLVVSDYEDNPAIPLPIAFTWTQQIDTTSTIASEDGNTIMSGDLLRLYLTLNKYLDGGFIQGRLIVKEIRTGVNFDA